MYIMPSSTSSVIINPGQMDTQSMRCAVNSISRFIHLVSCQTMKMMPSQNIFGDMANLLKLLKPVLDDMADCKIPSDEVLSEKCEVLDVAVNVAREFMESWSSKLSKICTVLQSEQLIVEIKSSLLEICCLLCRQLQPSPSITSLGDIQHCMQELQCLNIERVSVNIEEAFNSQREGTNPSIVHLSRIIESLNLTSSQELLKERIALEKERMMACDNELKWKIDQIDRIIDLMPHISDCVVKREGFNTLNGVRVPSYFCCPLSLQLMLDPVILASGQTYDRGSIQKWLDNGLFICPKTRQMLSHTNLIPNYTVNALIANWCKENHLSGSKNTNSSDTNVSYTRQDLIRLDSFGSSTQSNDSVSRSSLEIGNGLSKHKNGGSSRFSEIENFDQSSPEQSYVHSRTESASSVISSIGYLPATSTDLSRKSSNNENASEFSGEITSAAPSFPPTIKSSEISRNGKRSNSLKKLANNASNGISSDLTTSSHVEKLVDDLKSQSDRVKTAAAEELRSLAKHNSENRVIIGSCGAIFPLLSLLSSEEKLTQEHAVTALLNISIDEKLKIKIAESGAIEPLIHVLKTGNDGAKENAAAALFSLSIIEEYRIKIGRSNAVKALVDLLHTGTLRGKKDAATALYNLSIFHENKARIVQAGAVKYLVELIEPGSEMVDKAVALLANLSTITEGCTGIVRAGGLPFLVEVVETGSQRGKENAASILFQLCINSTKFCRLVLQEGAVPPLVALSQSGTPRAREKAQQLLSHFRHQREGPNGKGNS